MKKMAVFQVDLNIGGIEKSCVNFLNAIDTTKYKVDLYLVEKDNVYLKDIKKDINIKYIKKISYIFRLVPFNILKLFYNPHIKDDYDITIDFNSYASETAISAIKVKSSKKIIWVHNDIKIKIKEEFKYRLLHMMFKSKYKYFDTFVGVSKGALESFKNMHKIDDAEYKVIPNLIDTNEIKRSLKEHTNVEVDESKINIVSVGRVVHQKGFDLLVDFIKENESELDNFHFYIIGDGSDTDTIGSMILEYDLTSKVTLLGERKNPYAIMDKMDGFILLSRYEGQGMVFLEAKAVGLDIVLPKHLEKYVEGIAGTTNLLLTLQNIKHKKHVFNDLKEYNEKIIKNINNL